MNRCQVVWAFSGGRRRGGVTVARVVITGTQLTTLDVGRVARSGVEVHIADAATGRATRAWETVREVAARQPVYGRTTGVGATRPDQPGDGRHGLRFPRSHAGGAGPLLEPALGRAMLVVRLNQLAAGGAGVEPALLGVLADALNR